MVSTFAMRAARVAALLLVAGLLAAGTAPALAQPIDEDGTSKDTTYAYKDVLFWPGDGRAHRSVVVAGTPRAFLFELRD